MKKLIGLAVLASMSLSAAHAQQSYVFEFKNGDRKFFRTESVDSMTIGRDGTDTSGFATQNIWTTGGVFSYDLGSIANIRFNDGYSPIVPTVSQAADRWFEDWGLYYLSPLYRADELVLPSAWYNDNGTFNCEKDLDVDSYCDRYNYIAELCRAIESAKSELEIRPSAADLKLELAELRCLRAMWLFNYIQLYGPVNMPSDLKTLENPDASRKHFDYCVAWLSRELDEAAKDLPATRPAGQYSHPTSTAALAIKGRMLMTAASPLWNGGFPWPEWKNITATPADPGLGTPDYGIELVSTTYDRGKWVKALDANLAALSYAEGAGQRSLFTDLGSLRADPLPYRNAGFPGMDDEFMRKVLLMRYLNVTSDADGNHENIMYQVAGGQLYNNLCAFLPLFITRNNGMVVSGWSGVSPTLYTASHFLTVNGLLPENDPDFASRELWLKRAGLKSRYKDVTNLNVNREPRFYAWLGFDGGEYGIEISNGNVLHLDFKGDQRYVMYTRNYCVTGFLNQKFIDPYLQVNNRIDIPDYKEIYAEIRLAELYLNVAECYAALGQDEQALGYLNIIRSRAGAKTLTSDMVDKSGMSVTDWVRNERFVELWGENRRFFDVRRWMIGDEQLGTGKRKGLNADFYTPELDGDFEAQFELFNTVVDVDHPYAWSDRQYMWPSNYGKISGTNRNVYHNYVQAPGWDGINPGGNGQGVSDCTVTWADNGESLYIIDNTACMRISGLYGDAPGQSYDVTVTILPVAEAVSHSKIEPGLLFPDGTVTFDNGATSLNLRVNTTDDMGVNGYSSGSSLLFSFDADVVDDLFRQLEQAIEYPFEPFSKLSCVLRIDTRKEGKTYTTYGVQSFTAGAVRTFAEIKPEFVGHNKFGNRTAEITLNISGNVDIPEDAGIVLNIDSETLDTYNQANKTDYLMPTADMLRGDYHLGENFINLPRNRKTMKLYAAIADDIDIYGYALPILITAPESPGLVIAHRASSVVVDPEFTYTTNDQEPTEGALANLFDGLGNTFFHSTWSQTPNHDPEYGVYIDFRLVEPAQGLGFDLTSRDNASWNQGFPTKVNLYVSSDGNQWTKLADIKNMQKVVTKSAQTGHWGDYMAETPFRYLRFAVIETGSGSLLDNTKGRYFNAAELKMNFIR